MGAKSGLALKSLQWLNRIIQFGCAAVILGIFSYFLAALHNHSLNIPTWVKAVEGIAGIGVLYTLLGVLLLCCLAGHPLTSGLAILLDLCLLGSFIYIAVANRGGAGRCSGNVSTPFGSGNSGDQVTSSTNGFTNLPRYGTACRLETAVFAVAIIGAFFFLLSILMELVLIRHRRKEKRFGPSPANDYTSGSGRRGGFMSRFSKKRGTTASNDNALPQHTTPNQVRQSYNTESTAVGHDHLGHNKYGESGYAHDGVNGNGVVGNGVVGNGVPGTNTTHPYQQSGVTGTTGHAYDNVTHPASGVAQHGHNAQPANYRYDDGTYVAR